MPKRYKVIGEQPVLDHNPGESFDADIPEDQERFLIGIGGIRVVSTDVAHDRRIQGDTPSKSSTKKG